MEITFTRKEYIQLLELVYMADLVATMGGDDEEGELDAGPYDELIQKLYGLAEAFGCGDYVDKIPELGDEFFPSRKMEEASPVMPIIQRFENDIFWDELISRLAERDYEREITREPLSGNISEDDRLNHKMGRLDALETRYRAEFKKNGVSNLVTLFGSDRLS